MDHWLNQVSREGALIPHEITKRKAHAMLIYETGPTTNTTAL